MSSRPEPRPIDELRDEAARAYRRYRRALRGNQPITLVLCKLELARAAGEAYIQAVEELRTAPGGAGEGVARGD